MINRSENGSIFEQKRYVPFLALGAEISWGFAYPLIKLGIEQFKIDSTDIGGKALFAGIRFFMAGCILLVIFRGKKSKQKISFGNFLWLVLFGLVNTALHYFFFYIGLSNSFGSRASVIDSLGTFFLVIIACMIFPDEHMTVRKAAGCAAGFMGIMLLNAGGGLNGGFNLMGDGMMLLNAVCAAFGGVLTRVICRKMDTLFATGAGLALGGAMLMAAGFAMGGRISTITPQGVIILLLLVAVSAVGFSIYNQLINIHSVASIAIYNSLIPVFGVLLSCLLLGEAFELKYILCGLLVAVGVFVINFSRK